MSDVRIEDLEHIKDNLYIGTCYFGPTAKVPNVRLIHYDDDGNPKLYKGSLSRPGARQDTGIFASISKTDISTSRAKTGPCLGS